MGHTRYRATFGDHAVELEFDRDLVVLNRARLFVDGAQVDETAMVYGERDLTATTPDGARIHVTVGSGMVGEPQRPQLEGADGSWQDMSEG